MVPLLRMRVVGTFGLAAMYALSFVVVCLGTCFAADMAPGHSCCAGEEGFRTAATDCCSVVPGRGEAPQAVQAPAATAVLAGPPAVFAPPVRQPLSALLASTASPPLVLRI